MRQISFTLMALILPLAALAQPAKLEWPRTFTGQPDFAFTREEALTEARTRDPLMTQQSLPTMLTVAADETVPDPLRLIQATASADVSGTEISGTEVVAIEGGSRLLQQALAENANLPTVASAPLPDAEEFKATLVQTIQRVVQGWQPDPGSFDYSSVVKGLILQSVVTSPVQYAVINGQRLSPGQNLTLRVPVSVPDLEILDALQPLLPDPSLFTPQEALVYEEAYEAAIAEFAKERAANPQLGRAMLALPVVLKEVQPRQVVLEVYGNSYSLPVKFAY